MSINPLRAEKLLKFGEQEYKAKMSLDTMLRIEKALGFGLMRLAKRMAEADISMTEVITILHLAIRAGGNNVQEKDIRGLVTDIGIMEAIKMTADLITEALNFDDGEEKKSPTEE
tara:strand:+ start:3138 stop:3482 length:345 start_codon:yes stop_codon:yes gene_type:complete